ncbi:hypothetical protein D3C87_103210 [compost metagenome]
MSGQRLLLVYFILLTMSVTSWAQTSSVSMGDATPAGETKASTSKVLGNKKFAEDKEITDARLKADAGSLSRYSLKFSFAYFGPPVGDLGSKTQPNPDRLNGVYETSMSGSFGGRYRLDSKSAINLGAGVSALTPFHGIQRTDVKTPFVSYDRTARVSDVQVRNSVGVAVTTIPNFRSTGQVATLKLDNSMVYNLGASGFALGLDSSVDAFVFDRDYQESDPRGVSRYALEFYPQVKYNFTDKINIGTSIAMRFWNPRGQDDTWAMLNKRLSARTGMGIAVSRDIYFSPFLNYYPENFDWKTTTVSFATVFSVL